MLKVSRRVNYGLQLMIALCRDEESTASIPTSTLSKTLCIPLPFLHQIAHSLKNEGLIKALPGPKGGLRLNRNPNDITLLQIFESLEGKLSLPVNDSDEDNQTFIPEREVAFEAWIELGAKICSDFTNVKLSELFEKTKAKKAA